MPDTVWGGGGEFRVVAPGSRTLRFAMGLLAVLTAFSGLLTLIAAARGGPWMVSSMFLICGLGLVALLLWTANVRLLIGQGSVGYRNILRRNYFWSRGEIARAVEMAVSYGRTSNPQRGIYFFSLDGKRALILSSTAWQAQDLEDFVDAAGVQLERRDAPVKIKDARREFPNAFGWLNEHLLFATIVTIVAAIGLAIGAYALLSALSHT